MTNANGELVVWRHRQAIPIQRLNDATYYAALRAFGVSEAVSAALTAKLITLPETKGSN